jgi:general secretion pathway protein I
MQRVNLHVRRRKPLHQRYAPLNSGFSLLEVMVALAILAISLTALIGSQHQSMFVADDNDFAFVAADLAASQMAEVITSLRQSEGKAETISTNGEFGDNYPGYRWQADIERIRALFGSAGAGLERIDLKITDARRGRSFTLRKYRYATGQR